MRAKLHEGMYRSLEQFEVWSFLENYCLDMQVNFFVPRIQNLPIDGIVNEGYRYLEKKKRMKNSDFIDIGLEWTSVFALESLLVILERSCALLCFKGRRQTFSHRWYLYIIVHHVHYNRKFNSIHFFVPRAPPAC